MKEAILPIGLLTAAFENVESITILDEQEQKLVKGGEDPPTNIIVEDLIDH